MQDEFSVSIDNSTFDRVEDSSNRSAIVRKWAKPTGPKLKKRMQWGAMGPGGENPGH